MHSRVLCKRRRAGRIRHPGRVDAAVQKELSEKFLEMATWWSGTNIQKKPYSPTFHPAENQVTLLRNFTIPDHYKSAASSLQSLQAFTFPIPEGAQIRAILAVDSRQPPEASRFLFQASDQRQVLGRRFVLVQDRDVFRRLDSRGLAVTDHLDAIIENQELLFASFFQAKKFLPLDDLYREASNQQVNELFTHTKLKIPEGVSSDVLISHLTIPQGKRWRPYWTLEYSIPTK